MSETYVVEQRRETRHRVLPSDSVVTNSHPAPTKVAVFVFDSADDPEPRARGKLIDLSRGGAKVTIDSPVRPGETVVLRFEIDALEMTLESDVRTCWLQFADENTWQLGCAFTEELSRDVLSQLIDAGYIERRTDVRHETEFSARAVDLTDESRQDDVRVVDYSRGGICFVAPEERDLHEPFVLELTNNNGKTVQILCEALWQTQISDEFKVGCRFLSSDGFDQIEQRLSGDQAVTLAEASTRAWTFRQAAGLVIALMLVYGLIVLLF